MIIRLIFTILFVLLGGCAAKSTEDPFRFGRYFFGYEISKGERTGLIQVFNDQEKLYLKFIPSNDVLSIVADGEPLFADRIHCERNLCALPALYQNLSISRGAGRSEVSLINQGSKSAKEVAK